MNDDPREPKKDEAQSDDWEALSHEPGDREFLNRLDAVAAIIRDRDANTINTEAALSRVNTRKVQRHDGGTLSFANRSRFKWNIAALAIAAAALLAIGIPVYRERDGQTLQRMGIHRIGHQLLPDGTKATLGPMSSLWVPGNFKSGNRTVKITGEVFFEVVHDTDHPFTVRAGSVVVRDVGTKFSVNTLDSASVIVAVTEGEVELSQKGSGKVALQAGDKGRAVRDGPVNVEKKVVTENDVAWTRGTLIFRDAPLAEVSDKIWRWYGIHLVIADETLASRHLTAAFSSDSGEKVLEVIRMALGAEIEKKGDTAFVRSATGMRH